MASWVNGAKGGDSTSQMVPDAIKDYMKGYRECNDVKYITRVFHRIMSKVGLELDRGYGWHSIRRALATELALRGVSALNILRFMSWSHASLKCEFGMLLIYARCEQDKIDRSIFEVHPFLAGWSANVQGILSAVNGRL